MAEALWQRGGMAPRKEKSCEILPNIGVELFLFLSLDNNALDYPIAAVM